MPRRFEGLVGNVSRGGADGDRSVLRLGKTGEALIGQAHGEHYEAVSRGGVFYAETSGGVPPRDVSELSPLSTTAAFWLHNPMGSGVVLSALSVSIGYNSGTLGVGTFYLTSHTGRQIVNPTGTELTPRATRVSGRSRGRALAFATATVPTQIVLRPLFVLAAFLETSPDAAIPLKESLGGAFIVPPGFGIGTNAVAGTGTNSATIRVGMTWEEIPVTTDYLRSVISR